MEPWYKIATPRKEVREGRSFNPDEFAIHLEQVIAQTAPEDYREPGQFFSRTCFTRALREHAGMVLRRLSGETANTAPVMTLITQFGGGKTHTLTALYHLVTCGAESSEYPGVAGMIKESGIMTVPEAKVAAFVGNAWDLQDGRETPWIDIARQLAGERGVQELDAAVRTTPPGTNALSRVFTAVGGPVLLLFDEVLNFLNCHRGMAEQFYAFIQNLTVAATGTMQGAAVISLPRSQVEMIDWDMEWVVNDRRASLDEDSEIRPAMRMLIQREFDRGASIPIVPFPADGTAVQDSPRLTLVVFDPNFEWSGSGPLRQRIAEWTRQRGNSPKLYPSSLVWSLKKPGRNLREKVELWLAWKRVAKEIGEGTLGEDFDRADRAEIQSKVSDSEEAAKDEVWGGYRFSYEIFYIYK